MKVYGTDICIDCRNYKAIQKARGFDAEFISITSDTANLKEFLNSSYTSLRAAPFESRRRILPVNFTLIS